MATLVCRETMIGVGKWEGGGKRKTREGEEEEKRSFGACKEKEGGKSEKEEGKKLFEFSTADFSTRFTKYVQLYICIQFCCTGLYYTLPLFLTAGLLLILVLHRLLGRYLSKVELGTI